MEETIRGRPVRNETQRETYPPNRTCKETNCDTRLSQYNPDPYCYTHRKPKPLRISGRTTSRWR